MDILSVFSGCGGSDLGAEGNFTYLGNAYESTGHRVVLSIDFDKYCVDTLKANFNHTVLQSDLRNVTEFPDHDILIGGFPCQTFSTLGARGGFNDPRGLLYLEMVRILREKQPKFFIGENVSGVKQFLNTIVSDCSNAGYTVMYKLLNAEDYGIPQSRKRYFIVGVRNDIDFNYTYPQPIGNPVPVSSVANSNFDTDTDLLVNHERMLEYSQTPRALRYNLPRIQDMTKPFATITTKHKSGFYCTEPLFPTPSGVLRNLSLKEKALIQSFPDTYIFKGSPTQVSKQIGNAIPPVLMWHVIRQFSQYQEENK